MLNKVLGKIERGYALLVGWMMILLGVLVHLRQTGAIDLYKVAEWLESGVMSQHWGIYLANKLYLLETLLMKIQSVIVYGNALFGWYSSYYFAGIILIVSGIVLLISKMKPAEENPKEVNYLLVTLKYFNLFVTGMLAFVCYFTVTMLYFPDLAFSIETMWNPWVGIYSVLDGYIVTTLGALAATNIIIVGVIHRQLKTGWIIWGANIVMAIVWLVAESPKNGVSLDFAILLLVIVTVYHAISAGVLLFVKAPETK